VSVNTTNESLHVHNGSAAGGFELARADLDNVSDSDLNAALTGNTIGSLTITTADITNFSLGGVSVTSTAAELNFVDGVTSAIQTQIDTKAPLASPTFTGTVTAAALTVDTDTLHVDATNNRVGIGTSSPSSQLELDESGSGDATIKVGNAQNVYTTNVGKQGATAYGATAAGAAFLYTFDNDISIMSDGGAGSIKFTTGGNTQKMVLDSSGNLLVGKTSTAFGTAGLRFAPTGAIDATVSGDGSLFLNRLSSDGGMSYFYKDGSNVGTIGTLLGNLTVGTGDTGVQFNKDVNALIPHNVATGANVDNSIDLGYSDGASTNLRFKDLYLSGTANVGSQVKFNAHSGYDERTIGLDSTGLYVYNATDSRYDLSIDGSGNLLVGGTTYEGSTTSNASSVYIASTGFISANVTNDFGMQVNRTGTDGTLVNLRKNGADVGSISVSGSTVSYNPFMGSHYSETADTGMLFGTVMEATGDLVENQYTAQQRLTKTQVSTTSESAAVYGVWIGAMEGGGETIAAVGASWCRIISSATIAVGDLLTSNGDGTAKVQSDDIIRSKTIGKVTSTTIKETHADGSYVVPVVLYCG
jgi:hypothetical protein